MSLLHFSGGIQVNFLPPKPSLSVKAPPKNELQKAKNIQDQFEKVFQSPAIQNALTTGPLKEKDIILNVQLVSGPKKPLVSVEAVVSENGMQQGAVTLKQQDRLRPLDAAILFPLNALLNLRYQGFAAIDKNWKSFQESWLHVKPESMPVFVNRLVQALQSKIAENPAA
ncbi:MAG: hypothetical protein K2X66_06295 [Cyanobacteria bacterium]|nr:hypothetical protein [Cyanobacteriota bacterium]